MAYQSLYKTELDMKNAIGGVPYSAAAEIADTKKYLASGTLSKADAAVAQAYLQDLIKNNPTITESAALGTAGQQVTSNPLNPGTGGSFFPDYTMNGQTDANLPPGQGEAMSPATPTSALEWIQSKSGDIAIIVLGVMVVGIALFTSSKVRETTIAIAAKATGVPT